MLTHRTLKRYRQEVGGIDDRLPIIFDALSDSRRLKILKLLLQHCQICVSDIAAIFDITVSAASQQLKAMERSGIVAKERTGQIICYRPRVEDPLIKKLINVIKLSQKD